MLIVVDYDGTATWTFSRKSYRKARWRRAGQRMVDDVKKNYPGFVSYIIF